MSGLWIARSLSLVREKVHELHFRCDSLSNIYDSHTLSINSVDAVTVQKPIVEISFMAH